MRALIVGNGEPPTRALFDELLAAHPQLSGEYRKKLVANRRKVEKLYDFTRTQILTAIEKEKNGSAEDEN